MFFIKVGIKSLAFSIKSIVHFFSLRLLIFSKKGFLDHSYINLNIRIYAKFLEVLTQLHKIYVKISFKFWMGGGGFYRCHKKRADLQSKINRTFVYEMTNIIHNDSQV